MKPKSSWKATLREHPFALFEFRFFGFKVDWNVLGWTICAWRDFQFD
jgi:hypothetical protein